MKSSALGTILGAFALVGVGVVYFKVDQLAEKIGPLTDGRVSTDRGAVVDHREEPSVVHIPKTEVARRSDATAPRTANAERATTLEERVAALERRKPEAAPLASRLRNYASRWVRSVDDLSKRLKLTPSQKDRIADAVDRGKRRIQDILKIQDADGKSPLDRREERKQKMKEAIASGDHTRLVTFGMGAFGELNKQIPGRNATYRQEISRVKKETQEEIAQNLDADQQKTFEQTQIDPLLGESGGMQAISFFGSSDGPDGTAIAIDVGLAEPVAEEKKDDE